MERTITLQSDASVGNARKSGNMVARLPNLNLLGYESIVAEEIDTVIFFLRILLK